MSLQIFRLPDLGEGLTEADLVRWLVQVGDTVDVDEPIAEVETAKSIVEVPSPFGGVVAVLHGEEGETLRVGEPFLSVELPTSGEDAGQDPVSTDAEPESTGSGNVLIGYGTTDTGTRGRTRRRRVSASDQSTSATQAAPSASTSGVRGKVPVADAPAVEAPAASAPSDAPAAAPRVSSPLVRQLARDHGVTLREVSGSGDDGLIRRRDVEHAISLQGRHDETETGPTETDQPETDSRSGLVIRSRTTPSMFRRTVAAALTKSRTEIPEATVWVDVDATALLEMRSRLTAHEGRTPGILALVSRFVVAGLERFPALNGRIDTDSGQVLEFDGVNLGFAAQTERGLVVPAIRSAHTLTVRELDAEILRLTELARAGQAAPADLGGSTFTINNYGVFGVDGSAAIINFPEVAIMGLGRIIERPWVVDGQIMPRHIVQLSIVFDHRVCDGGEAAGLLRFVADAIENPLALYADL